MNYHIQQEKKYTLFLGKISKLLDLQGHCGIQNETVVDERVLAPSVEPNKFFVWIRWVPIVILSDKI